MLSRRKFLKAASGLLLPVAPAIALPGADAMGGFMSSANASGTTWNPADKAASITLSNGNLTATSSATDSSHLVRSTTGRSAGFLYFEIKVSAAAASGATVGICTTALATTGAQLGSATESFGWSQGGAFQHNLSTGGSGVTFTTNDILGWALDLANKKLYVSKNGVWAFGCNPATGAGFAFTGTPTYFAAVTPNAGTFLANFGASAFANSPPSSASAWL